MLKVNSSIKVTDPHSMSQVRRKTEEGKEKLLEVGNQSRSVESQHCQLVTVSFCGGSEDKAKPWIPSLCWITVSNINPPGFYEFSNPPHTTEKLSKSVSRHCELQERNTKPEFYHNHYHFIQFKQFSRAAQALPAASSSFAVREKRLKLPQPVYRCSQQMCGMQANWCRTAVAKDSSAVAVRRKHPSQFPKAG